MVVGALLVAPGMAQAAPANDNFADATPVTTPAVEIVDTAGATMELGEQDACNNGSTVWYRFDAVSDDAVQGDTHGSNFDTVLAVYTGDSVDNLDLVTCNDDSEGLLSEIVFEVEAGETYFIQAGGFGGNTGELQLNLHQPGAVEGTVTEDAGGDPLGGICVTAYVHIVHEDEDDYYEQVGWATTEADGTYRLAGVDGSLHILFEDCQDERYVDEFYDDASSLEEATTVLVPGGTTVTGIDAALTLGGSISGRVSDLDDDGLDGICLEATTPDGLAVESTYTRHDGTYRIGSLPAGSYAVAVNLCGPIFIPRPAPGPAPYEEDAAEASLSVNGSDYESEWYDDKPDLESADLVSVVQGEDTPGIDASIGLRPRPDLAVTELAVENVPLVTDAGPLPTGTGWNRRISFTIENQGNIIARGARIAVRACTVTDGACDLVQLVHRPVAAGQVISASIDWNALGAVGDVVILVTATHWDDPNGRNDYRTARHYVLVGGTGVGVTACGFGPTPNACL